MPAGVGPQPRPFLIDGERRFADGVRALTGGRGTAVILDSIGAAYLEENVRALAGGRRLGGLRLHNLVSDPAPFAAGEVDLVVCRNVTIYFGRDTTRLLMGRFHDVLAEGGYLLLGHSETLWQVGGAVTLVPISRFPDPARRVAHGSLLAPMPGAVTAIHVGPGDAVERGQPLLVLEAMKMQHVVAAPAAGVVRSVTVEVGAQVEGGSVLAVVTGEEESGELSGEPGTA